jgi:hypothetical protein
MLENVKAILRDAAILAASELRLETRRRLKHLVWSLLHEDSEDIDDGKTEEARLAMIARMQTAWMKPRGARTIDNSGRRDGNIPIDRAAGTWCPKCGVAHAGECS